MRASSSRSPISSRTRRTRSPRWAPSWISPAPAGSAAASIDWARAAWSPAVSISARLAPSLASATSSLLATSERAKKVSKHASTRATSTASLARVTARASFSRSRSAKPTSITARWASIASAGETATSHALKARMKSASGRWTGSGAAMAIGSWGRRRGRPAQELAEPPIDGDASLFEFQQQVQGLAHQGGIEGAGVQQHQGPSPVHRFRDRGQLAQVESAQILDEGHQLGAKARIDARDPGLHDPLFEPLVGPGNVQMKASAFERIAKVADVVGGQKHHGRRRRPDHAELGNRNLEGRKHLEKKGFEAFATLVDFVDSQHRAGFCPQRLKQRPRFEERFGEKQVADAV